jgi:hypothetical protein
MADLGFVKNDFEVPVAQGRIRVAELAKLPSHGELFLTTAEMLFTCQGPQNTSSLMN